MAPTSQINICYQMNTFRKHAETLCGPRVLRKVDLNSRSSLPVISGNNSVGSEAHIGRDPPVLHSRIR
jgi:hypothetical protein